MSMRHEAAFSAFTMSMEVVKNDGSEIAPADLAYAEFFEGAKVLAGMIVGKYELSEQDALGWMVDLGESAAKLQSQRADSENKEGK
jgi:hypothetical protein